MSDGMWINSGSGWTEISDVNDNTVDEDYEALFTKPSEPISMEFTIAQPDPDLLGLLTGGVMGNPPEPTFAIECTYPIKRTFWQWLRRKPRQYGHLYVPHARLED